MSCTELTSNLTQGINTLTVDQDAGKETEDDPAPLSKRLENREIGSLIVLSEIRGNSGFLGFYGSFISHS
jgi:hypothetical protein